MYDEMFAVLKRIASEFISDDEPCNYCKARREYPQPILQHAPDCPIAQARNLLQRMEPPKDAASALPN